MPRLSLPRWGLPGLLTILFVAVPALGRAQDQSLRPGINQSYVNPNVENSVKHFEGEKRDIFQHREAIVEACRLAPGERAADIGAGTGLFTRLMAVKVGPQGKVYAVDISQKFLDHIQETCREQKLANVATVLGTDTSTGLVPDSVDLAFVCDTYHHFEFPYKTLASLHAALRPGGRLVVVDYQREPGVSKPWILEHVRAGKQTVIEEITRAGFRFTDELDLMKDQYLLRFEKPAP